MFRIRVLWTNISARRCCDFLDNLNFYCACNSLHDNRPIVLLILGITALQ